MKPKHHVSFISWRFYLTISILLLVVIGLIIRMIDLTIINRDFLEHQGEVRSNRVINSPGFRGMILDRNHNPLAVSTAVFSIWVNPQEFVIEPNAIKSLNHLLELKPGLLQKHIQKAKDKHKEFTYLKRDVTPAIANAVKKLGLAGIYLQEESKRYYPEGEVASQIVGFTNVDDKGQEGLELAYNKWLTGVVGKTLVVKDRRGRAIANLQTLQEQKPGNDLVLSIDRRIQYLAYRVLMDGIKENVAKSGTVIVLDTQTGEILAMANLPSFNPNNRVGSKLEYMRNRAVTDTFEPGSTIKAFSIATALDSGRFKPETLLDTSPGWFRVDKHLVRDEHNEGVISVAQVLQLSSNVGTTKMILSLQPNQLWSVLHRIGFGETTGIGFPGEQSGSLVPRTNWRPFAIATLSFGYGISVTPLQLAQAYSIFANEGVKKPVSLLKVSTPPQGEQVINPTVAKQMLSLLESVTTAKRATGELAKVPGYRVAGKTGTALMAGMHGYQKHHYISTFVGIAPVSHPRLVVAVVIHDPQGKHYYASFVAAPLFQKIMEGALRILNVPPDDINSLPQSA